MNFSETVRLDPRQLRDLRKLVRQGEGQNLEFKRKVSHPDKVVREMIAFANTQGGIVLIGVDDDGAIPGLKYPEEESLALVQTLAKDCRPLLAYEETIIPVSENRFVLQFKVPASARRPHYYIEADNRKSCYVRTDDMTVKTSREMTEIVRRSKKEKDIRFTFGPAEKQLMEYLDQNPSITLSQFRTVAKLNRFMAAKKLILLVLANVLRITPTEKGDLYSRV